LNAVERKVLRSSEKKTVPRGVMPRDVAETLLLSWLAMSSVVRWPPRPCELDVASVHPRQGFKGQKEEQGS